MGEGCFCRGFGANSCTAFNFLSRSGSSWHALRLKKNHSLPGGVNVFVPPAATSYAGGNCSDSEGVMGPSQKQN